MKPIPWADRSQSVQISIEVSRPAACSTPRLRIGLSAPSHVQAPLSAVRRWTVPRASWRPVTEAGDVVVIHPWRAPAEKTRQSTLSMMLDVLTISVPSSTRRGRYAALLFGRLEAGSRAQIVHVSDALQTSLSWSPSTVQRTRIKKAARALGRNVALVEAAVWCA